MPRTILLRNRYEIQDPSLGSLDMEWLHHMPKSINQIENSPL
jgi:hypothetical protein